MCECEACAACVASEACGACTSGTMMGEGGRCGAGAGGGGADSTHAGTNNFILILMLFHIISIVTLTTFDV